MALACNNLVQTAYAAGYAKLSERELVAAGVASLMVLLYTQGGTTATDVLALAYSLGLPKLTERDLDAAFAASMCSITG